MRLLRRFTSRRLAASAVVVGLLFAGAIAGHSTSNLAPQPAVQAAPLDSVHRVEAVPAIRPFQDSYAPIVAKVAPAVVTVRSERRARQARELPLLQDPSLREFFGDRFRPGPEDSQPRREAGLGSGVIVSSDGYILTNHHVIDGAEEITVELNDRRSADAKVVGSDPLSDLAVLKINGSNFPTLPLGDSDAMQVGDVVLAIGNPLGIGQTVTMGIISGKGRATGVGDGSFEDFLQTDAPINRGNSGGALVNTRGELVGINSQILSPSGGNIGIAFAIPASMARGVMDQLLADGKVRRGMLGITVQPVTSEIAANLRLPAVEGAIVAEVKPGGPADQAGVRRGDVITKLNGSSVSDSNSLRNHIARMKPGTRVALTAVRNGHDEALTATLAELPVARGQSVTDTPTAVGPGLGLAVEALTPELADQLGVGNTKGLVVSKVAPDGPAAEAGIRSGDVIEEVNGHAVRSASELQREVQGSSGRPVLILVNREGRRLFVRVSPRA